MDGRRAAYGTAHTFRRSIDGSGPAARLCGAEPVNVLPSNHLSWRRVVSAHPPTEGIGPIFELADRLTPFAGADALAVAHQLVLTYGSPIRALGASRESLAITLSPRTDLAHAIVDARELADYASLSSLLRKKFDPLDHSFLAYLQRTLAHRDDEILIVVFLDPGSGVIACEPLGYGDRERVAMEFRSLIARTIELGASKLVLAHNHPSGDATPSKEDWASTARLIDMGHSLGIEVLDHLIVCKCQVVRMSKLKGWVGLGVSS